MDKVYMAMKLTGEIRDLRQQIKVRRDKLVALFGEKSVVIAPKKRRSGWTAYKRKKLSATMHRLWEKRRAGTNNLVQSAEVAQ